MLDVSAFLERKDTTAVGLQDGRRPRVHALGPSIGVKTFDACALSETKANKETTGCRLHCTIVVSVATADVLGVRLLPIPRWNRSLDSTARETWVR